jgi:hypothetical protein
VVLQETLSSQSVYLSIVENECGTIDTTGVTTFTPPKVVFRVFSVVAGRRRTKTKVGNFLRRLLVEQVEVYYNLTVDLTALGQLEVFFGLSRHFTCSRMASKLKPL